MINVGIILSKTISKTISNARVLKLTELNQYNMAASAADIDYQTSLFGGLSISSLDSGNEDDPNHSDEELSTHTTELYQRLQDLDEMTGSFLHTSPLLLNSAYSSYTDIEPGSSQEYKLVLPSFDVSEVLTISVACISAAFPFTTATINSQDQNKEIANSNSRLNAGTSPSEKALVPTHHPIAVSMYQVRRTDDQNRTLSPMKNDFMYEIKSHSVSHEDEKKRSETGSTGLCDLTLTAADGIGPGTYIVKLSNILETHANNAQFISAQQIKISYQVYPSIRATPIAEGEAIEGAVALNQFCYFRYTHTSRDKLITIRVKLLNNGAIEYARSSCDPDLYVSNAYNGLVGVTRQSAQWCSIASGCDRVDIHPFDPQVSRGNVFVIGVMGYGDSNAFELSVSASDPLPLLPYMPGTSMTLTLKRGEAQYFAMRINSLDASRILLSAASSPPTPDAIAHKVGSVSTNVGRGCYCTDSLVEMGWLPLSRAAGSAMPALIKAQASFSSLPPLPPVLAQSQPPAVCPVIYLSGHSLYPCEESHCWRASSADGFTLCIIETDEWAFSSEVCYFSVRGLSAPDASSTAWSTVSVHISSTVQREADQLTGSTAARYATFAVIFEDIDGNTASQRDRVVPSATDDQGLTYGEVTYLGMVYLLEACGSTQIQHGVFYDLGCGSGKAVIAAALNGFGRCVGVELLPSLCACAEHVSAQLLSMIQNDASLALSAMPTLEILQADVCGISLVDADVVFVSSLCFSDAVLSAVLSNATAMRAGGRLATLKMPLDWQAAWELEQTCWIKMTWSRIPVYVLRRK